jgi:hypothetical protein
MKPKTMWTAVLCLGLVALGGDCLAAADKAQVSARQELRTKMAAKDWKEISPGVFERRRGTDKVEHLGYGREGLVWTIGELTRQHDALMREYQSYPSEDLHKVIDRLSVKIAEAQRELRNTKDLSGVSESPSGCSVCYSSTADAYPLSGRSGQGVGAIADASFNSNCGSIGDTYAYVFVRATLDGTTVTHTVEDPHTGSSVTSHAAATVNGTTDCYSNANSSAHSAELGISYSIGEENYSCPPPPLQQPTITGPATATINGASCQNLTWTATASGGTTPYSYAWTIDGVPAGTGSSVTKSYCGNNTAHSQSVDVAVTVTDSSSPTPQTAPSPHFTTAITYTAIPPLTVTITDPGPTTIAGFNCKILTWLATASGGTTPYSYAWTIDGVAAGTGTSISKSYCGNNVAHSQTVNATVTVTDSSSPTPQTASASSTTVITYTAIPQPKTTISGPATATIPGTTCKTLTWTATTSGGTPPYSYAWKISGVAAGTSSSTSVSKSYCGNNIAHTQSVPVTLTVTDAASQTASDSFTTTITYTVAAVPTVTISSTNPVSITGFICKTITWTSTVSGGTSPYTYAWKIDGVAAGTSSSTSVSKSYCGSDTDTTQTVSVTLAVTDAASQTGSAAYTTTINYTSSGGGGCTSGGQSCQ